MSSAGPETLAAGTRLAHFEIRRLLGSGAMGSVYEAHDTSLDRPVAIKVVHKALVEEEGVVERFTLEPRAAARVVHENVTHVYFVGTTAGPGEGRPFYAMELVPGRTLEEVVAADGPLPLDRAIDALVQAGRGLAAAHAAGLVHRDVKPSNLLLTPNGRVKVTDFGLAKSIRGDSGSTQHGSLVGTPDYMSPEQCRGRDVDARTDIYLLGLTAFYVLTGSRPWTSESIGSILDEQMNAPLRSVTSAKPSLSPAIDRILARLCAKDPAQRPQTMADAIALLETLRPRRLDAAALAARGAAVLIDIVVWAVLGAGIETGMAELADRLGGIPAYGIVVEVVSVVVFLVLTLGAEARFCTTIGKRLLHLEVRRDDGTMARLPPLAARFGLRFPIVPLVIVLVPIFGPLGRTIAKFTQLAAVLAGVGVFLATRGRTLSDLLTRTRVVYRAGSSSR
jgi:uncharacterized RDD family membrane protein YckC